MKCSICKKRDVMEDDNICAKCDEIAYLHHLVNCMVKQGLTASATKALEAIR